MVLHAFAILASARGLCLARRLYSSCFIQFDHIHIALRKPKTTRDFDTEARCVRFEFVMGRNIMMDIWLPKHEQVVT